jgi:hypothetical protein
MIEIGPNLLMAIQAVCALGAGAVLAFFMYRLVMDC